MGRESMKGWSFCEEGSALLWVKEGAERES